MSKERKHNPDLPQKQGSGDIGFDNAVNAFFPNKQPKSKLQLLKDKYGVTDFNDGKTHIKIKWDIIPNIIQRLSKLQKP